MAILIVITALSLYLAARFTTPNFTSSLARFGARFLLIAGFSPIKLVGMPVTKMDKPVIYAANHASYMDAVVALALMPNGTRFVAKKELFSAPIIGTFMKKMGHLSVDRTNLSRGLEDTVEIEMALKSGHSVWIFPEGTFGYAAGLRPFRLGAFKIAAETGVPVVPVAIRGARKILRDGSWLMQPHRIRVTLCDPEMPAGKEWQDITRLRQSVRAKVAQFCGETSLDLIAAQTIAPKQPKG